MKWILVAWMMVAACAASETVRVKRWPTNRRDRDARMEKIDTQLSVLVEQVKKLEAEVAALRGSAKPVESASSDSEWPPSPSSLRAPTP